MIVGNRLTALVLLTCASIVAGVGCHPKARPHEAALPPKPANAAAPPPPSSSGFPTPEEAFKLVRFRTEVEVAEFGSPWHPDKLVPIKGGFALLMSWSKDYCYECKATLGVAYFRRVRGRWEQHGLWDHLYRDGWNGRFGDVERIDVGQPNPTVAVHGGWFLQGCSVDALGLVELAPRGPIMRVVRAPLGSNNGGETGVDSPDFINYETSIELLKGRPGLKIHYFGHVQNRQPLDLTVVYSGSGQRWKARPRTFRGDCGDYWRDAG